MERNVVNTYNYNEVMNEIENEIMTGIENVDIDQSVCLDPDDADIPGQIDIVLLDGRIETIDARYTFISNWFSNNIRDCSFNGVLDLTTTDHRMSNDIIVKILDYMRNHEGKESTFIENKPLRSGNIDDLIDNEYDRTFINQFNYKSELIQLLYVANYFEIPGVITLAAAKIAGLLYTISISQINTILQNDRIE